MVKSREHDLTGESETKIRASEMHANENMVSVFSASQISSKIGQGIIMSQVPVQHGGQ